MVIIFFVYFILQAIKDDDCELFNIHGSGLLTQAQLRQIGDALRAEVNPISSDELQAGVMGHEPGTSTDDMDSVMMGPQRRDVVVSGDNPMFSGSDQQVSA